VGLSPDKERCWPNLVAEGYSVVSEETWQYNCIAFAADIQGEWWWPDPHGDARWPDGVQREERLQCFAEAYGTIGYQICEHGNLESGYEKIAIYTLNGIPTHAAKQLPDGRWKSKLGAWEDIEHETLRAVEEYIYGEATLYLKRKIPS